MLFDNLNNKLRSLKSKYFFNSLYINRTQYSIIIDYHKKSIVTPLIFSDNTLKQGNFLKYQYSIDRGVSLDSPLTYSIIKKGMSENDKIGFDSY